MSDGKRRTVADEDKLVKARMGLRVDGRDTSDGVALGRNAMAELMEKAAAATIKQSRATKRANGKKKRGGQPGNKNAGLGKGGIYAAALGEKKFKAQFNGYSKALGRYGAQEELALARAMQMNILSGKDPLGMGEIDDPELLNAYANSVGIFTLKALDLKLKEEKQQMDKEAKEGNSGGVKVVMGGAMAQSVEAMKQAQQVAAELRAADEAFEAEAAEIPEEAEVTGNA